ncbi:MAG: glycosyltransferase family 2 protein [Alphaproteobacteria bacterium]|nr:glycosyltransferase family 2 protein [Alphaproteobacteria bacterium]
MKVSLIICSYGRPPSLAACLKSVASEASLYDGSEIILVYTLDDSGTAEVMNEFAKTSRTPVKVCRADKRGLSVARNVGIANSTGDLLFFTDDDCLMQPGHLGTLIAEMESEQDCDYGGGGVHDVVFSPPGTTHIQQKTIIKPRTLFLGGIVSGCNMFFRRKVFEKLGGFREDMGAASGTSFIGPEDLEMAARASFSGMTGVLLPGAVIVHDHKRLPNSNAMKELAYAYNVSRGSFFAYMMMHGVYEVWNLWAESSPQDKGCKMDRQMLEKLQQEFYGAAEYIAYCLKNNIDL